MINEMKVGNGHVFLIAGDGSLFYDVLTKFCESENGVEDIMMTPQDREFVKSVINSGYKCVPEFDDFIFGISGYSRIIETQLPRLEIDNHPQDMEVVTPVKITRFTSKSIINPEKIYLKFTNPQGVAKIKLNDCFPLMKHQFAQTENPVIIYEYNHRDILNLIDTWYNEGMSLNIREEDLTYMKPRASEFKAIIKMSATELSDFFRVNMCFKAQKEIRDLATKMYKLCYNTCPQMFENMGSGCKCDGYCKENVQCREMRSKIPTKEAVLKLIKEHKEELFNVEV